MKTFYWKPQHHQFQLSVEKVDTFFRSQRFPKHIVWKSQKKSHSTLRAKRAKLQPNSDTRQVNFNRPKIVEMPKMNISNATFLVIFKHSEIEKLILFQVKNCFLKVQNTWDFCSWEIDNNQYKFKTSKSLELCFTSNIIDMWTTLVGQIWWFMNYVCIPERRWLNLHVF